MSQETKKIDIDTDLTTNSLPITKRKIPIPFSIESLISKDLQKTNLPDKPPNLLQPHEKLISSNLHLTNRLFENYRLFCVNQQFYPGAIYPANFGGGFYTEPPGWNGDTGVGAGGAFLPESRKDSEDQERNIGKW